MLYIKVLVEDNEIVGLGDKVRESVMLFQEANQFLGWLIIAKLVWLYLFILKHPFKQQLNNILYTKLK